MGVESHVAASDDVRGERQLRRVAGALAAGGALLILPLQALLPVPEQPGDVASYFSASLDAPVMLIYLAMSVAVLLLFVGIGGVAASLMSGPARGWAASTVVMAGLGGAVAVLLATFGGVAFTGVAQTWQDSGRDAASLAVAEGVWWIGRAAFIAFALTLFATIAALGVTVAMDGRRPAWLGWTGATIGSAGISLTLAMGYQGPTQLVDYVLFPIAAVTLLIWVTAIGVLTWRSGPLSAAA